MYLSDINVSEDVLQCAELHCDKHVSTICQLHDNSLDSCIKATVQAISRSKPLCKNKRGTIIPGWTDDHSIARDRFYSGIAFGLITINLKLDGFQK